jgi:Glycosyl transferase family 2
MSSPWLSIVTITKDDPVGLRRTLASAAGLRAIGAEHLVIDGGEESGCSRGIAAEFGGDLALYRQPPQGVAAAFNAGLGQVHGEWVWFLNGGDAVYESLDAAWLRALLGTTRAQVVTGAVQFDGEATPRAMPHPSYQWPLLACWLAHPATLVRREKLQAVGGFAPRWRVAADYDLWFRILGRGSVVDVLSVPLARFASGGISERPSSSRLARREDAAVILVHSAHLVGEGCRELARVARRIAGAAVSWLLHRPGRAPAADPASGLNCKR